METNFIIIVLTGIAAGAVHVLTGPDHLAAIAPFAANHPKKSWKIGFWWGMGHSSSIWIIALLVFLMKAFVPLPGLAAWSEKLVGFVLIGLGIWGFQKTFKIRFHYHVHEHSGRKHAHFHMHSKEIGQQSKDHQHSHAPLSIGVIHGFAGSSHIIAILPAIALPGQYNAVGFVAGFGLGTIIAMICFSWIMGILLQRFVREFSKAYRWTQISFSLFAIAIGIFWLLNN